MKFNVIKFVSLLSISAFVFLCTSKKIDNTSFATSPIFKPHSSINQNVQTSSLELSFLKTKTEKYINSNAVVVKALPNDESDIVFTLDYADFVTVTGDNKNNSYGWVQINVNGQKGYIDNSFLSDEMLFFEDYQDDLYITKDYITSDFSLQRNDIVDKLGYNNQYIQINKSGQNLIIQRNENLLSNELQPNPKYEINYNYIQSDAYIPVVEKAYSLLGVPYGHGYSEWLTDCVGLTMMCYKEVSVDLPWSLDQAYCGESVPYENAVPGDIIIWSALNSSQVSHVGLYVGEGQMIHSSSNGVVVTDVSNYIKYGGNLVDVRHIAFD